MRISDWSSDVCSSDLIRDMGVPAIFVVNMADEAERAGLTVDIGKLERLLATRVVLTDARSGKGIDALKAALSFKPDDSAPWRSEGRRVGEEGVRTCGSRGSPYH